MNTLKPKVSIIGCGNVGLKYAYALMISGIARQVVIVDIDKKRLEGEVMDLSHGEPYISRVEVIAGDYPDVKDSDLVVITAGRKQSPGQTRIDLVRDNVELYKKIIPELMKYSPDAVFMTVTNPVDILAYATYKISGKLASSVISSGTVLDTARFRFLISQHCKIDPHNIHAYILGEHGDTEFAVWSKAMIGGVAFKDYCSICQNNHSCKRDMDFANIFNEVKNSAYKIIERKGETSYGIGLALVRITQAILNDENAVLPVSSLVDGYLGVNDVYLSLPAVVNKSGVKQILKLELDENEKSAFLHSAATLKNIIKEVGL